MNFLRTIFFLFALLPAILLAGEPDYAVKSIKPALLKNANAVVRKYSMNVELVSLQEVTVQEHYVITVLNEKGDHYANHAEEYSKLKEIDRMYGYIFDEAGNIVTKIKQSDFIEVPLYVGYPFYSDDKVKYYNCSYRKYPYTVEYVVETRQNYTFYLPSWSPSGTHCAIESADLTVITHGNTGIRYKEFNTELAPVVTTGDAKEYKWTLVDITATKREPMTSELYTSPTILLATDNIMLEDHAGNLGSWQSFGQFIYELNKGRDVLPQDMVTKVKDITAGISDDHKKAAALYAYLQKSVRYVAVEYGIGGWQTLEAGFVAKNQYGDCKGLSNYMMSMLEATGITAYPVIIHGGADNERALIKDFVSSQGNHEILCVPFAKDTMWLECTSSDLPAGYLSNFTQNRDAVMITPDGGWLVHTPVYDTADNLTVHRADITYSNESLVAVMDNIYDGEEGVHMYHTLKYDNDHKRTEFLQSKFHLPGYSVDEYKFDRADNPRRICVNEHAKLSVTGLATKTGSRSFISLDVCPINIAAPEEYGQRKTAFYIPASKAYADTFTFHIPVQADVEFVPPATSVQYPFGRYSCEIVKKDDKLIMIRKFALIGGTYEAALFDRYLAFTNTVSNESQKKIVLKNKS